MPFGCHREFDHHVVGKLGDMASGPSFQGLPDNAGPLKLHRRPYCSGGQRSDESEPSNSGESCIFTSSHGQTIREAPPLEVIWTRTVPTSVTVPTRQPSRTVSPIWNFTIASNASGRHRCPAAQRCSWPVRSVIQSGDSQFTARMPAQGSSAVAPVDLVSDSVAVDDDAGATPMTGAREHGVADNRSSRVAADNHGRTCPNRCLISATNRCP